METMRRHLRRLLFSAFFMMGLLAVCGCRGSFPAPERVFLITIDTLRADHLGLYGYPRETSPFLDSLGEAGLVFDSAYASSSNTAPSHASLFTSLYPAQHRVLRNGERLHESLPTLAQLFQEEGYETAAFTTVRFLEGLDNGFDHFHNEDRVHPAKTIFGRATEWIRSRDPTERHFLWIHLYDVHQWNRSRQIDREALRAVRAEEPSGETMMEYLVREHRTLLDQGPKKVRWAVDRYDGQIVSTDAAVRSFYEAMESEGLGREALWIVTSDHGEGLGNHRFMGHGMAVYDEQIRVPLLYYFSDLRYPARRFDDLVRLVDVAPTLAELVGTSFKGDSIPAAGVSMLPLFEDAESGWGVRDLFTQVHCAEKVQRLRKRIPEEIYALRTARYKIIGRSDGEDELYDLRNDPFELENLAADGTTPETERLLEGLARTYRAYLAQSEHLGSGEIDPDFVKQLRALGYL